MIRKLIIGVVLAVALSAAAGNAYAQSIDPLGEEGSPLTTGEGTAVPDETTVEGGGGGRRSLAPGGTVGLFCEVEKVDVCVMTQTEGDCTKLGGEKVDSCSMAEKAEDKK